MSIRKTIITATIAVTTVAMVAPSMVGAVTIQELQAQISALQAQLLALQAQPTATGNAPAMCAGVTFVRNLKVGSSGSDVKCLQGILNSSGYNVAQSGPGSPGNETSYFGSLTLAAAQKYQAGSGITPASQVGPLTRAKLNAILGVAPAPSPTTPTTPVTPIPTGSGLAVMLASDNPAGGTVVDTQGLAPLAKLVFVNGDNAEVKITSLKLKRLGISADATLTNVYLFQGAKRLTDAASVATTIINFNDSAGLFMVPAGGSTTISVLSDVDGSVGETVGVSLRASGDVTSNSSSIKGTFPLNGNLFNLASGTNLATFYFSDTTTPSASSIDPQDGYTAWQNTSVAGTRASYMHRIAFRVIGTVDKKVDLKNFKLLIDGVQVGSMVDMVDANDYVTFDLSASPVKLDAGSRVFKVLTDVIGGSNKNFYLSLRSAADVTLVDSQLNVPLKVTKGDTTTAFTAEDSGTQTVNAGTITVTKMTSSAAGNIVNNASNASLAKFEFKAAGEKVKIEWLRISVTASDASVGNLRNGAVYANGVQIGSTTDIKEDSQSTPYTQYSFGSSLIVVPGTPTVLEVKSDIFDNDGTNHVSADDTLRINIEGGDFNNASGQTSLVTIDAPSADVSANTVTVKEGALTLSKYTAYTNATVVTPLDNFKLAHFTLTADTTEAVNVTTIQVDLNANASSNTTNMYVKYGTQTTSVKATVSNTNSWSINYQLSAGQTVDVTVFGNVSANAASGTLVASVLVSGTTVGSAAAVNTNSNAVLAGQTITVGTGTLTRAVDSTSPQASIVSGGQSAEAGKFRFTASNDSFEIRELRFTVGSAAISSAISTAALMDGSTTLGTVPYDGTNAYFNFTGLKVSVPVNTYKVLTLVWNLSSTISSTFSNSQVDTKPTLDYIKHANSQGTETTSGTDFATNKEVYVFKSVPTVSNVNVAPSTSSLTLRTGNTVDLYSWKIKADSKGSVDWKQIKFSLNWADKTADSTLQLYQFILKRNGIDITSLVSITDEDGHNLETTTAANGASETSANVIIISDTEEGVNAGAEVTYLLRATASGFAATASIVSDDAVSINMAGDATVNGATKKYLLDATAANGVIQLATSSFASGEDANFIWSDDSDVSTPHSATAGSSSGDWANGYLVKDLPLSSVLWSGP